MRRRGGWDPGLDRRLQAARPGDPSREEAQQAAVRVLARLAVLEHGFAAARSAARPTRVRAAAALVAATLAACLLLPVGRLLVGAGSPPAETRTARTSEAGDVFATRIAQALEGDALMRARLLRGGPRARRALLDAAERGGVQGRDALRLLRAGGPLRGEAEAQRIARMAAAPLLREAAVDLLAADPGPVGARLLGDLLTARPAAEADVVAALRRVADRGRRKAALGALLRGVQAGREKAAAAAVQVGGAGGLAHVVEALPATLVETPGLVSALQRAPATVRGRLLRMAARGDERALRLAARARVEGVVAVLAVRAKVASAADAATALAHLAHVGTVDAWLGVARALDGPAAGAAQRQLETVPLSALNALRDRARRSARDAPAAMAALAAEGGAGVARLDALARESRLAVGVVRALATGPHPDASALLLKLAERRALAHEAVRALGLRLVAGRKKAGAALLELSRGPCEGEVLRLLRGVGPAGRSVLTAAARDRGLEPPNGALLEVDGAGRGASGRVPLRSASARGRGRSGSV